MYLKLKAASPKFARSEDFWKTSHVIFLYVSEFLEYHTFDSI